MPIQQHNIWRPSYLPGTGTQTLLPFLEWWYRLTSPPSVAHETSFRIQEASRRARLMSSVVLLESALIAITILLSFSLKYYILTSIQIFALLLLGSALICNRLTLKRIASILIVCVTELDILLILLIGIYGLHFHQSLYIASFIYLLLPELVTALLLPTSVVFIVVGCNSFFTWFILCFTTRTPLSLNEVNYQVCLLLLLLYCSIAVLCHLWVSGTLRSIMRADSVEVVAALEHTMAEHEHAVAQQKRALEHSIMAVMQTHLRVANGDFHARVPLAQEDVLWPIAGSLNTLLARIQRLGRESAKLEKTELAAAQLAAALRAMRTGGSPIPFQRSGTAVDLIILELATVVEPETQDS